MPNETLAQYIKAFSTLNRNRHPIWGSAPHKPVLLLAVISGIEHGWITTNQVKLGPELVAAFQLLWRALVPTNTWDAKIIYPFRYLASEGFWELLKDGHAVSPTDFGHPTSVGQFQKVADSARLAPELWTLLRDATARGILKKTLLDTYFDGTTKSSETEVAIVDPLAEETDRLFEYVHNVGFRKRPQPKLAQDSDEGFVRHALFPRVIRRLYSDTCAICRLNVSDLHLRSLVESAHIMPFAEFGSDDPRNGIALCPNHHKGLDLGWFTVSDAYAVHVSPKLRGTTVGDFVREGATILLPNDALCAPSVDALAHHRHHVFQR